MIIYKLIIDFLKIGAFSFGGGYAIITLIQKQVVENNHWISPMDFVNIVAIAEMTPGPIAVNTATFVGYNIAGFWGSLLATVSVLFIPIIVSIVVSIYFSRFQHLAQVKWILNGLKPAVLALIAAACYKISIVSIVDYKSIIIAIAVFVAIYKFKVHPILALVLSGIFGYIFYAL